MKKISTVLMAALLAASMGACGTNTSEGTPVISTPEAVVEVEPTATPEAEVVEEATGAVGTWHLVKVSSQATPESDILELSEEDHQSFYAENTGNFTLNEDGTGMRKTVDGEDVAETELTWTEDAGNYTVVEDGTSTEYIYDADADVLVRKVQDEELGEVTFVYIRDAAAEAPAAEVEGSVVSAMDAEAEVENAETAEAETKTGILSPVAN